MNFSKGNLLTKLNADDENFDIMNFEFIKKLSNHEQQENKSDKDEDNQSDKSCEKLKIEDDIVLFSI